MATRLVPSEGVLPFLYPVFNLSTTIVSRNYLVFFKIRVGRNESGTREELTRVPFYFTDHPSGFIPAICLIMELDRTHLYPALWGTTDRAFQVTLDVLFKAVVGGDADEVSNPVLFAVLVEVRTGKCRIAPEPRLLEPRPVAVNPRRDKVENAIG